MNVSDYSKSVRFQLGLAAADQVLSDEVVLWALNGALRSIATDKDWPWLLADPQTDTTVADTPTFLLPENHTRTSTLKIDGRVIEPATHIAIASSADDTGHPAFYAIEANAVRLYPTPDGAYAIVHAYYRSEPELVLVTDSPLLPDAYSEALVYEAAVKAAIRTNRLERLQTLREAASLERKKMVDNYVRASKPGRIRKTRDSIWPPLI